MAATESLVCSGTCNTTQGSIVQGKIALDPLYFLEPATGIIYECPADSVVAVRQEMAFLDDMVDQMLKAQGQVDTTTKALHDAQTRPDVAAQAAAQAALEKALAAQQHARDSMYATMKDLPKFNDGANSLMEILPLATHKGKKLMQTRRMTYVRSAKIKNHFRTYDNLKGDAAKMKAFYTKDPEGSKLDQKKLSEAMHSVKLKSTITKADTTWWAGEWAPSFVQAFNARHAPLSDSERKARYESMPADACLQFDGGVALLRFFAGVGGEAKVELGSKNFEDLLKGRGEVGAKVTATARAGVDLVSGKVDAGLYLPAKKGLHLHVAAGKSAKGGQQELDLGYIRLLIEGELTASCGASAVAEIGLEFKVKADMTAGVKGSPTPKTAAALADPKAHVDDKRLQAEAKASGELSAFAGAEAGAKVSGALQWQQAQLLDFADFAKINAEGKAQAGIGGVAMFNIGYDEGKFKIRTKLGACVGLGLKGEISAEVGVVEIVQFDLWFKHQVMNALDQNLHYFQKQAFDLFVYMKALAIAEGRKISSYLGSELLDLRKEWQSLARKMTLEMIRRIADASDELLSSLAEVKALLIDLLNSAKQELKDEVRSLVWRIMASAQTDAEKDNVYQRLAVAADDIGTKGPADVGRARVAAIVGESALESLEARFKTDPTPGYALAMADSAEYAFQRDSGTHLAWQRTPFGNSNSMLA
jgi:hypothetical protein